MKEITTKYYIYEGDFVLWISTEKLSAPIKPISWHKSLEAAERAAEKYNECAIIIYDDDLLSE